MDKIIIHDLEVFYRVGVPDQERAAPQRLLLHVEMIRDLSAAAASDNLSRTIDYQAVARRLVDFGEGRSWRLIEKLKDEAPSLSHDLSFVADPTLQEMISIDIAAVSTDDLPPLQLTLPLVA